MPSYVLSGKQRANKRLQQPKPLAAFDGGHLAKETMEVMEAMEFNSRRDQDGRAIELLGLILLLFSWLTAAIVPNVYGGPPHPESVPLLISNPEAPLGEDQTIAPQQIWRLGNEDGDQSFVFGLIGDAIVDEQGNTYLLDTILSTIYKIGPDGINLANLGREGDGPGEFRNARSLTFMPGGDIGILQMMPDQILVLGRDGLPRGRFSYTDESTDGIDQYSSPGSP